MRFRPSGLWNGTCGGGGTFIDVGANIGYISAVAAGLVGPSGHVHSFEPVPRYFNRLKAMADANPAYGIHPNQCAIGEAPGTARISVSKTQNIGWNTIVPGFMDQGDILEMVDVPIVTLSDYIEQNKLRDIAVIKVDTEGFEYPALRGLEAYFRKQPERPVIICEVAPQAYGLMGHSLQELDDYMRSQGYRAMRTYGDSNGFSLTALKETTDVVFQPLQRS